MYTVNILNLMNDEETRVSFNTEAAAESYISKKMHYMEAANATIYKAGVSEPIAYFEN